MSHLATSHPSPTSISSAVAIEDDSDRLPCEVWQRAMDAVDSLGFRVTVGDVSSKSGLNLDESLMALLALAYQTDGFFEVSKEGDVLYVIPPDYRSKLTTKSIRRKIWGPLFGKAMSFFGHLLRFLFGAAVLIACLLLVWIVILGILVSLKSDDKKKDKDKEEKKKKEKNNDNSIFNIFSTGSSNDDKKNDKDKEEEDKKKKKKEKNNDNSFLNIFSTNSSNDDKKNDKDKEEEEKKKKKEKNNDNSFFNIFSTNSSNNVKKEDKKEDSNFNIFSTDSSENKVLPNKTRDDAKDTAMSFTECVSSFVLGDGDPNQGIKQERWKRIGEYISSNGGVITAEEIAPYLDTDTLKITLENERYILPVLLRFRGQPEIDDEGYILYRFPSLQRTGTASSHRNSSMEHLRREWPHRAGGVEHVLKEKKWQFSKTGKLQRAVVIGLGAFKLFGVITLWALLNDPAVTPSEFITVVRSIFPLIQIYAVSFFAIPIVRCFFICNANAKIENRNRIREQCARVLESPDLILRHKLLSARHMAQNIFIGQDQIICTTEKDLLEQDYNAIEWNDGFQESSYQ